MDQETERPQRRDLDDADTFAGIGAALIENIDCAPRAVQVVQVLLGTDGQLVVDPSPEAEDQPS